MNMKVMEDNRVDFDISMPLQWEEGTEKSILFHTLGLHQALNIERQKFPNRLFISDYDGGHPFIEDYLGELAHSSPLQLSDVTKYAGVDRDRSLRVKIAEFHSRYDDVSYSPEQIIPGGGSSSFLATICTWLALSGYKSVYYLPPLYYKLGYFFRRFGILPIPVSNHHAFQPEFHLNLPQHPSVLVLSDPLWYGGRRVPIEVFETIREWQINTGSLVFVDGTFQYMGWNSIGPEASSTLVMNQTLRLISPTKYLALHGSRCAYLLTSPEMRGELDELHINLHGDVSVSDRLFAHRVMDVMLGTGNRELIKFAQDNRQRLIDENALGEMMEMEAGWFLFAQIRAPRQNFVAMGQEYFELSGYPNSVRINLLNSAGIQALIDSSRI